MKRLTGALAIACMLAGSYAVAKPAQSEKQAQTAIDFRQALFQLIRSNVGALGAMNKGQIPFDPAQMEKNGVRLEQLSLMMADYFVLDTSAMNAESSALDKIWQNQADFNAKADELSAAALKLQAAAQSGDEGQYKAAIGGIFKSCKGCHDNYKAD